MRSRSVFHAEHENRIYKFVKNPWDHSFKNLKKDL